MTSSFSVSWCLQRLEALARSDVKGSDNDEQKRLELEWQQLEFATRALEKEKQHAPPLEASAVLDIRTRAELHDLNSQYASALEMLKFDLTSERDALQRENQLHSDLDIIKAGLTKRYSQLQRKRRQDLTSESAIRYVHSCSLSPCAYPVSLTSRPIAFHRCH